MTSSRMRLPDLVGEALAGMSQRPGRSLLTMLGTVLGIGSFVAIIGLSDTASSQITAQFNLLNATQVTVTDIAEGVTTSFPDDADDRMSRLNGVEAAGVWWVAARDQPVSSVPAVESGTRLDVYAATQGTIDAAEPALRQGVAINSFHQDSAARVALLGTSGARSLGITSIANQPAIFVNGQALTVIGVVDDTQRLPQLSLGLVVPASTARELWGPPRGTDGASMIVKTALGASQVVSRQAPLALRPDAPQSFRATAALDPTSLRRTVEGSVNSVLLSVSIVAVVVGAIGIANTSLVAVLERRNEIGLRRALGARRRHIAGQFLVESTLLGLLGGMIGTALGVVVSLSVAIARDWTAVLNPLVPALAPIAGALVGLLAGSYPALRAASVQPAVALRQ
ncbi:ABC transporter permease [Lentzea alba]|uniref:ABC transporter permease n=1 Tax=Lentzea alba TaxID=2714351 RepID=UPI0039BFDF7D